MKKIRLNLDDLEVASFQTMPEDPAKKQGTIHGYACCAQCGCDPCCCQCGGACSAECAGCETILCQTMDPTCTCEQSCDIQTCEVTCLTCFEC